MVAPVNPQSASPAGLADEDAAVRRGGRRTAGSWLLPSAVAKAAGGELLARGRSADGVVTDSRADCAGKLFVALRGERHDGHEHVAAAIGRGARGVVIDRPLHEVAGLDRAHGAFVVRVRDTGEALLQLAAEHRRRLRAKVVGITGSCGKTTTKDWLASVLAHGMPTVGSPGSYNNHVGVPLTLFGIRPETRAAVVEIGTNAPGEIRALTAVASPDVAIVTCVAPAHLQGLGSLAGVAAEKTALPAGLRGGGLAILNGDDVHCRAMAAATSARTQFVAIDREADWFATDVRFHALGTTFRLRGEQPVTVPRLGTHNVYNALFVIAAASELGMAEAAILHALTIGRPASRRLEPKCVGEITIFDDTYNMNPESARAGLQALAGLPGKGRRIVVFGEMLELGAQSVELHRQLGAAVHEYGLDVLVTVGAGARAIADGAVAAGKPGAAVHGAATIEEALGLLRPMLRAGDRVLCKASRRVALDGLVDRLVTALGGAGAQGVGTELEAD